MGDHAWFDSWRTPALKRVEILRTESMDSQDGALLSSSGTGLSCLSAENKAGVKAAISTQAQRQPGWETVKARRVLQVDVQCSSSTPGCNLEELIRQLEEPLSPTFRLTDMTGTARADLFGIASPDPAGGQQCSASASLDPPQPAGHDFMPDPWEDQFIYSQVQLEERTQSMPLLGFVESRHFEQARPQHAFHPAFSMPLPEVIGWPEEELSASFCCQGGTTGLPQGLGEDRQPSLQIRGSAGAPCEHAAAGQRDADGEAGPPAEDEKRVAECPQQSDRSDGTGTSLAARPHGEASKKCTRCGVTSTPQWRVGPSGPRSLCNACGVKYKKELRDRGEVAQVCLKRKRERKSE